MARAGLLIAATMTRRCCARGRRRPHGSTLQLYNVTGRGHKQRTKLGPNPSCPVVWRHKNGATTTTSNEQTESATVCGVHTCSFSCKLFLCLKRAYLFFSSLPYSTRVAHLHTALHPIVKQAHAKDCAHCKLTVKLMPYALLTITLQITNLSPVWPGPISLQGKARKLAVFPTAKSEDLSASCPY